MSIYWRTLEATHAIGDELEQLIPKLNELYERELSANRIVKYSKYGIKCEYAYVDSQELNYRKVKRVIGWGIGFPKDDEDVVSRIIIFRDLIDPEYLDMAVAHEACHEGDKEDYNREGEEKEAFTLELQIAELVGKKEKYLEYMKKEYPWRIELFRKFGLID